MDFKHPSSKDIIRLSGIAVVKVLSAGLSGSLKPSKEVHEVKTIFIVILRHARFIHCSVMCTAMVA